MSDVKPLSPIEFDPAAWLQEIDTGLINKLCNAVEKHRATIDALTAERDELRKQVETLRTALLPFAST